MTTPGLLKQFTNPTEGMQSVIALAGEEYKVSLLDLDSGEYLPTHYLFDSFEKAERKAKFLVGDVGVRNYDVWLDDATNLLSKSIGATRGDSQGLVEAHSFVVAQEWAKGSDSKALAKQIKLKSLVVD